MPAHRLSPGRLGHDPAELVDRRGDRRRAEQPRQEAQHGERPHARGEGERDGRQTETAQEQECRDGPAQHAVDETADHRSKPPDREDGAEQRDHAEVAQRRDERDVATGQDDRRGGAGCTHGQELRTEP